MAYASENHRENSKGYVRWRERVVTIPTEIINKVINKTHSSTEVSVKFINYVLLPNETCGKFVEAISHMLEKGKRVDKNTAHILDG